MSTGNAVIRVVKRLSHLDLESLGPAPIAPELLREPAEKELLTAIHKFQRTRNDPDHKTYFAALAELEPAATKFLDEVTVNADDCELRTNRYGIVKALLEIFNERVDFEMLADHVH